MKSLIELCKETAKKHGLLIDIADQWYVFGPFENWETKKLGSFDTVHGMYCFLCGYDAALMPLPEPPKD